MYIFTERVRFYEADLMGVVHHSNYLRWFEMGRIAYLRSVGVTLNEIMASGYVFPITEVSCQYKSPAHFDDLIDVRTTLLLLSPVKMRFRYEIVEHVSQRLLATGETLNVFTTTSGKIARLPAQFYDPIQRAYAKENVKE